MVGPINPVSPLHQDNFNPNTPFSNFYNTTAFASNLEKMNGFYVQQSDQAWSRSQRQMNEATAPDTISLTML
jgi:hypothetical protein